MFIHFAANFTQGYMMIAGQWVHWILCGLNAVMRTAPFVIACLIALIWISGQFNHLPEREWAASRGVDVRRFEENVLLYRFILTGAITGLYRTDRVR